MAISKPITTDSGAVATYHKVASVTFYSPSSQKTVDVEVESYLSQNTRNEGKEPLLTNTYHFAMPSDGNVSIAWAYSQLIITTEFTGATNA